MLRAIEAWALRRAVARGMEGKADGRLLWVRGDGEVVDLGPTTTRRLLDLGWAVGVAYRYSRDRGEKGRLAPLRVWMGEVSGAIRSSSSSK